MSNIQIRKAKKEEIHIVEKIQARALDVLEDTEQLDPVSREELLLNIQNDLMALAIVDGQVGAFRTMHIPTEDYLGHYIGITDSKAASLIYSDITIVDPEFRGLSLQRKLGEWLFNDIEADYQIIMATVHPKNTPSIKDKFHLGMQIVAVDKLYGGKLRFIFMKDLVNKENTINQSKDTIAIECNDIEKIKYYLDMGYKGVALQQNNILFGK